MAVTAPVTAPKESPPEQARRGRLLTTVYATVVLAATAGFVSLAVFVQQQDVITNFDVPVAQAIQSINTPILSWILLHTSDLGWAPLDIACVVVIAGVLAALRLRLEAVMVVVSTLLAGGIGTLTKDVVQRARPTSNFVHLAGHLADFSFPSGHVIFATVLFGTTFGIVWIVWPSSLVRNAVLVLLALLVLLMGPSRIYMGQHWPTDVLGAVLPRRPVGRRNAGAAAVASAPSQALVAGSRVPAAVETARLGRLYRNCSTQNPHIGTATAGTPSSESRPTKGARRGAHYRGGNGPTNGADHFTDARRRRVRQAATRLATKPTSSVSTRRLTARSSAP